MKIKLSQWAKNHNVCYKTAWNYYKEGRFEKTEVNEKGSIFVFDDSVPEETIEDVLSEFSKRIKNLIKNAR